MTTADELRETYGRTWVIHEDMAIGVAAWRKAWITNHGARVNVLAASDLDGLREGLAAQAAADKPQTAPGKDLVHIPRPVLRRGR